MKRRRRRNLRVQFGGGVLLLTLLGASGLWLLGVNMLPAWWLAITTVTFLAYGYDKAIAGRRILRVPEAVLLGAMLAGGTLGGLAGMYVFRHKTAKPSFQSKVLLVLAVQAGLLLVYFMVSRGP